MGRHAAPGDEPDPRPEAAEPEQSATAPAPAASRPTPRGRHAHPDDAEAPAAPVAAKVRRERPSQADLRLLRTDSALRNRVIAAVVVPFVLYLVVLLTIGRLDAFAIWLWLPLITAGVTAGLLLDGGHKGSSKD